MIAHQTIWKAIRLAPSAMLTFMMSVPLLFSFQMKAPPDFLVGLPFILLWTWAVLSVFTVPVLAVVEIIICVVFLRRRDGREVALRFHATALAIAIIAEIVYVSARAAA